MKDLKGKGGVFKFTCFIVKRFYKKRVYEGLENIPKEPCIIVANHSQYHGPLSTQLYYPREKLIWTTGEMTNINEVADYTYNDFWSKKPKIIRWVYRLISYVIAPFCVYYFKRSDSIPVYKDARLRHTFKDTIDALENGKDVIIFAESKDEFNNIVNEFQDKFVDVAKLYYKKCGKKVNFLPMYVAGRLKKCVYGKPISYNPELEIQQQREVVCNYLKQEITNVALSLPSHVVVPYANVSKKKYKKSK